MNHLMRKLGLIPATLLAVMVLVPIASARPAYAASAGGWLSDYRIVAATGEQPGDCKDVRSCDIIYKYVNPLVNFLAALVGVAVVASIIIGGIQYSSSAGDPAKASAAKARIRNAIIALAAFMLLWTLLNFLIPGGVV